MVVTIIQPKDEENLRIGEEIYETLSHRGVEVLFDDRDVRPGVKFADAELIGIPYRVTIGPKGIADGVVELVPRATGETMLVPFEEIANYFDEIISKL